jgi:magnesium-protoporphyrin IX monomethyl ester (oxidative) cyclase
MYRHLEKHPEQQFYPLFRYFESWCQDENRHGDIFKALLHSQPRLLNNWRAKLWMRFFLLMVFATHTMTVHERTEFYRSVGLDPTEYDTQVVRNTNETAARAFSVVLDVDNPDFFPRLQRCSQLNNELAEISQSTQPKVIKFFRKMPKIAGIIGNLVRLYLIKPIDAAATWETVR